MSEQGTQDSINSFLGKVASQTSLPGGRPATTIDVAMKEFYGVEEFTKLPDRFNVPVASPYKWVSGPEFYNSSLDLMDAERTNYDLLTSASARYAWWASLVTVNVTNAVCNQLGKDSTIVDEVFEGSFSILKSVVEKAFNSDHQPMPQGQETDLRATFKKAVVTQMENLDYHQSNNNEFQALLFTAIGKENSAPQQ